MNSSKWREARLGDIIEIEMGQSPKSEFYNSERLGLPFLQGNRTFGYKYPFFDTYCTQNKKIARKNDVIMSVRAPVGDLNIATTEISLGRGVCAMRLKKSDDNEYLFYLMKHNIQEMINQESGTVFGSVNKKDILGLKVMITENRREQQEIAHILSTLDEKIEVNNKINKTLEEMAQAIFKRWFVDFEFPNDDGEPYKSSGGEMVDSELGPIPKGWEVGTLTEISEITMGQSPSGSSYNEDGIGTVFYQGRTDFGRRFPTSRLYTTEPRRMALAGDILLSVRAPVGDINIAVEECCIGRGLCAIRPNQGVESFVYYQLLSLKSIFDIYNGEGTVFGSINKNDLKDIKVILPAEDILSKFDNLVSMFDQEYKVLDKESRNLISIRDSLLPKLMSGEIRVPIDNEQ